jgi:raffinose/stachyose/melibiose transport system substrate-binding protein
MKWEKISQFFGFSLVAICFILALTRVIFREVESRDPNQITIRFAHWQLEGTVPRALDTLAAEYMKLHPGIKIEQIRIPNKVFAMWSTTQLVGETAPDLIQMEALAVDKLVRYMVPLTNYVYEPNPYNKGNEFENIPWRDTFFDGLVNTPSYNESLLELYGIPQTMYVSRVFYNKDLFKKIMGDTPIPQTYEEFQALCEAVKAYSKKTDTLIIPLAASRDSAGIGWALFGSQTQRLIGKTDSINALRGKGFEENKIAFLNNELDIASPEYQSGLRIFREISQYMQSGYTTLNREDAAFYFLQGRAVMTMAGSWDASTYFSQSPFNVGVFTLPLPSPNHPDYGRYVLGPVTEAGLESRFSFGLSRTSAHPEIALDFLKFITSKHGNETFSKIARWLPAVRNVPVIDIIQGFKPVSDGFPSGPTLGTWGPDVDRLINNNLYLLSDPNGSVEKFTAAIKPYYNDALISEARRNLRERLKNSARMDSQIGGTSQLSLTDPSNQRKVSMLFEAQNFNEGGYYYIRYELKKLGISPDN